MLIEIIKSYILTNASSMITSKDEEERILFSGPSKDVLKSIHDSFSLDGPAITIPTLGSDAKVPVFFINSKAKNPDKIQSAACTPSYLMGIRNSSAFPILLALVPHDEAVNKSLVTTTTSLGLDTKEISSFSDWQRAPFIREILDTIIEIYSKEEDVKPKIIEELLIECLKITWESNQNSSEQKEVWEMLCKMQNYNSHEYICFKTDKCYLT